MTWTRETAHMQTLDADSRYRVTAWWVRSTGDKFEFGQEVPAGRWMFRGHRVGNSAEPVVEIITTPDAAEARAETERQWERNNV